MPYLEPGAGKRLENYTVPTVANLAATVGTADGTIADVGAAFNQANLNDNFRDVADKLNAVLAALRTAGIIA